MTENLGPLGTGTEKAPVSGAESLELFDLEVGFLPTYYTAISHRPPVSSLRITNRSWEKSCDELVFRIRTDVPGTEELLYLDAQAFPAIEINDKAEFHSFDVRPNLLELAALDDAVTGNLIVELFADDQLVGRTVQEMEFLAYNQWMFRPGYHDSLAAFVMPRHPMVLGVMSRVGRILQKGTGDSSLGGYQQRATRVLPILRGIYLALSELELDYRDPPESFEGYGQKVRTPDVVVAEHAATCLDSTVLFASCMAAAGLDPLIFCVRQHAFVGCWRSRARSSAGTPNPTRPNIYDANDINLVQDLYANKRFLTIETTAICGEGVVPFEMALVNNESFFTNEDKEAVDQPGGPKGCVQHFESMTDVVRTYEMGLRRLPRRDLVDGRLVVVEDLSAPGPVDDEVSEIVPAVEDEPGERLQGVVAPRRVLRWLDALLDLGRGSGLINMKSSPAIPLPRTKEGITLPLVPGQLAAIEDVIMGGKPLGIVVSTKMPARLLDDPTDAEVLEEFETSGILPANDLKKVAREVEVRQRFLVAAGYGPADAHHLAIHGEPDLRIGFDEEGLLVLARVFEVRKNNKVIERHIETVPIPDGFGIEATGDRTFTAPTWLTPKGFVGVEDTFTKLTEKRFRRLKKAADEIERQSASNQLYLTIGTMVWRDPTKRSGTDLRSPLYLVPVQLSGNAKSSYSVTLDTAGGITPNYCLLEKLRIDLGLEIPEMETPELDESGIDVQKAITAIRETLGKAKHSDIRVEESASLAVLNFASFRMWKDLSDNWQTFRKNPVVEHLISTPHESFENEVDGEIGEILCPIPCDESQLEAIRWAAEGRSFVLEGPPGTGKSQTIANLIAASMALGKRVLFVAEKREALDVVRDKLEAIGFTPFCIVMHHETATPEGVREQLRTAYDFEGEDQSDQWASDSAVIDSVSGRLADYAGALHERNALQQSAWTAFQDLVRQGADHTEVVPDYNLSAIGEHRDAIRSCLLSLRSVVGANSVDPNHPWGLSTISSLAGFDRELLEQSVRRLLALFADVEHLGPVLDALFNTADGEARSRLIKAVRGAPELEGRPVHEIDALADPAWFGKIDDMFMTIGEVRERYGDVLEFLTLPDPSVGSIPELEGRSESEIESLADPEWLEQVKTLAEKAGGVRDRYNDVLNYLTPAGFDIDLSAQIDAATEALSAGVFSRKRKRDTLQALMAPITNRQEAHPAAILTLLQKASVAKDAIDAVNDEIHSIEHLAVRGDWTMLDPDHMTGVVAQAERLANTAATTLALSNKASAAKEEVDAMNDKIRSIEHLAVRGDWTMLDPEHIANVHDQAQRLAVAAVAVGSLEARVVREMLAEGRPVRAVDAGALEEVSDNWSRILDLVGATPASLARWAAGSSVSAKIAEHLDQWTLDAPTFLELNRWSQVIAEMEVLRSGELERLADDILEGSVDLDNAYKDFEKGLVATSLSKCLNKGVLGQFERTAHDRDVAEYVWRDAEHKALMQTVIPRRLVDNRPFKAKVRMGKVGALERELAKQARKVSLPKLIRQYGDEVTHLTPCFLMSPDAVCRLLPANSQFFDTVVFDEASQIRVAAAIPAMGRAKAAIIVGDSKQMPPSTAFARAGGSSDDDEPDDEMAVEDLESIMEECRESNLPSLMLKSHYRSRHEGLIAFSNKNFYKGDLVTFPAPNAGQTTPIHWHPVQGQFDREEGPKHRTNDEEAKAIVAEIIRRVDDPDLSKRSMGVVTLNANQRELIQAKLEDLGDKRIDELLNHPVRTRQLFVVALEQVQGDERDVILLSIAFSYQMVSRGETTKKEIPNYWGPLQNKGGERRLNVAITRAKYEIAVFCSFDPDDMNVSGAKWEGVKMLQQYLQMARSVSRGGTADMQTRAPADRDHYRSQLLAALHEQGITARENLGISKFRIDISVSTPDSESPFLAIMLDGPAWADRSTTYDRDLLPSAVLRGVGWRRLGRVWLPSHIYEPANFVTTVKNELERDSEASALQQALAERGYEVRQGGALNQMGLDFALRESDLTRWPLAVRLTGPGLFHQYLPYQGELPDGDQVAATDCHTATQVWIPDWLENPDRCLKLIDEAYLVAAEATREPATAPLTTVEESNSTDEDVDPMGEMIRSSPYCVPFEGAASLPQLGTTADLEGDPATCVAIAALEILEIEAPIPEDRIIRLVLGRFGITRLYPKRIETIRTCLGQVPGILETSDGTGSYFWSSKRSPTTWKNYRMESEGDRRDLTKNQISHEEIRNAMVDIVRIAQGAYSDELIRRTFELFGRTNLTTKVANHLRSVLDWASSEAVGSLLLDGEQYLIPLPDDTQQNGE